MARNEKGQWQKGESGHPGGFPREIAEVRKKLRALLPEATEALAELLKHDDGRIRAMAIREVYDRTMGKAAQPVTDGDGKPLAVIDISSALARLAGNE